MPRGNPKRNRIYAIAGGVLAVLIVAAGGFLYLRGSTNPGVPPLPANARMFNNWALIGCDLPDDRVRCVLLRRAVNQQTRRLVMQMTIARAQGGTVGMVITLPPNVAMTSGVTLTPMGGTAVKGAIRACQSRACTAAIAVNETLVKEMSTTDTAALEFAAANGRASRINVNIAGFAQGFAAWQTAARASVGGVTPATPANTAAKAP